jgi:predicted flap endonuclease-1-like 5' DNA nuclease
LENESMTARRMRWMPLGLLVSTVLAIGGSSAWASHYRIGALEVFDEAQLEALRAAGVETTEEYLQRSQTRAQRQELAAQTGISELEVIVFARLCELLQIEGIGPRAAQLLRAAGVVSVEDLAAQDPVGLEERVAAVNAVEQLTGVTPSVENLTEWIAAAAGVAYHVR